jgi:tRNA A37 threonylcarbamoyladenosine synthetase subunit TsaC/SUA5/YrdC
MFTIKDDLEKTVRYLKSGKTVIFPTETSYGLGCDATNQEAVDKIFKIKKRSKNKSLLVVVPTIAMAKKYLVWNEALEKIANKYWLAMSKLDEGGYITVVAKYNSSFQGGVGELGASRGRSVLTINDKRIIGLKRTVLIRSQLRKESTKAESFLWNKLRGKKLNGLKFRRQHGIGSYIVDFYQPDSKLVIELDGDIHFLTDTKLYADKLRNEWLENRGYTVAHYNNVDIFQNIDNILGDILRLSECLVKERRTSPCPILERRGDDVNLAKGVVASDGTVAIRVSNHPVVKYLSYKLGRPIVATSSNISGEQNIYSSSEIIRIFKKRKYLPDIFLNYGDLPNNKPSTIVSVVDGVKILRQGGAKISNF